MPVALEHYALVVSVSLGVLSGCAPAVEPAGPSAGTSGATTGVSSSSGVEASTSSESTVGPTFGSTSWIASTEASTSHGGWTSGSGTTSGGDTSVPRCMGDWPDLGCALLDEPNVEGTVSTPHGSFQVSYAYFGAQMGCSQCIFESNIGVVYLLPEPIASGANGIESEDMLVFFPAGSSGFIGPTGTSIDGGQLRVVRSGVQQDSFEATFEIGTIPDPQSLADPFDPQTATAISGRVQVNSGNWDVDLTFSASYCPLVNEFVICE